MVRILVISFSDLRRDPRVRLEPSHCIRHWSEKAGSEKAAHVYTAENYTEEVREIVASVLEEF